MGNRKSSKPKSKKKRPKPSKRPQKSKIALPPEKQEVIQSSSFTTTGTSINNVLRNNVKVNKVFDPNPSPITQHDYIAIWDTGAMSTCITPGVVKDLGLIPTGMKLIKGANSTKYCPTHWVSLYLPNNFIYRRIRVTEIEFSGGDVLIGMDIISQGDFAVTNYKGKTKFSFRIPSITHIDFVEEFKKSQPIIGRNDPCYCGSTKKFKYCHGA
ncbi:MAG: SEC-C domain-containing protein [Nitrospinae bacterium]|nr:SEC-C domain-containing protein [Nitrospinota bacterium]